LLLTFSSSLVEFLTISGFLNQPALLVIFARMVPREMFLLRFKSNVLKTKLLYLKKVEEEEENEWKKEDQKATVL